MIERINEHSSQEQKYYSRAVQSPFGQKVFSFYTNTSKQIGDIHEEARRIADTHKTAGTGTNAEPAAPTTTATSGTDEKATGTTTAPTVV